MKSNNNRWWENYLIRYGLGTVVGSICVYYLYINIPISHCNDIFILLPFLAVHSKAYSAQLILLIIYGLAFNYIASAPGLVLHAVRRHYLPTEGEIKDAIKLKQQSHWCQFICILLPCIISLILITFAYSLYNSNLQICKISLCKLKLLSIVFSSIVLGLIICHFYAIHQTWKSNLFTDYKELNKARKKNKIDKDSYAHLREHGNAFLIVILNIILTAFLISSFELFKYFGLLISFILWIAPAAIIYFLGHKIEAEIIKDYKEQKPVFSNNKYKTYKLKTSKIILKCRKSQ